MCIATRHFAGAIQSGCRCPGCRQEHYVQNVNAYDSRLKGWVRQFHGILILIKLDVATLCCDNLSHCYFYFSLLQWPSDRYFWRFCTRILSGFLFIASIHLFTQSFLRETIVKIKSVRNTLLRLIKNKTKGCIQYYFCWNEYGILQILI